MKKQFALPAIAVATVLTATVIANKPANAFWPFDMFSKNSSATNNNTLPPVIQALVDKFGLNTDEVKTVISDTQSTQREERQQQMQQEFENRLNEAVDNGNITNDQKQLLLQKHQELQAQHEADFQNREQQHDEMLQWAQDNGIDPQYLYLGGGGMGMRHSGGMGMRWDR